jgi:glycine/D-amino acid oxidase-like deaminating enzyme
MLDESNYWLTTIQQSDYPDQPLPARVDVVVIGGGFSGLSCALTLAKAGISVAVLEAETMGWGASSRNGGMVLTGMKLGVDTLIQRYGLERARRMFALSLDAINTVENIVVEENIECAFSRCGHLEMAWKPAHFEAFTRAAELLEKGFGHHIRLIPQSEQHNEIGSERYHGGMLDELSAGINPAQYVMGLARAVARAGAGLYERTRVLGVEARAFKFCVHTNRGDIQAEKVFTGTSGYTGPAIASLQKRLVPIGSYIIATAPLPDTLAKDVNPYNRMIFDSKNYLYYFRLTPDQRMLFGGRAVFSPESESSIRQSAAILKKAMIDVYPQLKEIPVQYAWGGSLDFAVDNMPHLGELDGIHYALGYAGHGVAFASHFGKLAARKMLGEAVEKPLDGLPFQPFPFHARAAWYLPLAGWYYRLLDVFS